MFDQAIECEWCLQYCQSCCQTGPICNVKPHKQALKQNKPKQTKSRSKKNQQIWINKQDQPAVGTEARPEVVTHIVNDEGWKQVKGKSTSKHLVGTSQERAQGDFNNCFSPLQETTFQQVFQAAMDVRGRKGAE